MASLALLKFGAPEHMGRLLNEGLLHCETVAYFTKLEDEELRGDRSEGLEAAFEHSQVEVVFGDIVLNSANGLVGYVEVRNDAHQKLNIFCMYGLNAETCYVDPLNYRFGSACVVIHRPSVFRDRIVAAVRNCRSDHVEGIRDVEINKVEYIERGVHHGDVGLFRKYRPFEYQHEYRVVLGPGTGNAFQLRVGSLTDIAIMVEASKVNDLITLQKNLLPGRSSDSRR